MKYVIDRSKWVCGGIKGLGISALLNDQGRMCCLGQICSINGIADKFISGNGEPQEAAEETPFPESLGWLINIEKEEYEEDGECEPLVETHIYNSEVAGDMIGVNDDTDLSQKERESKLKALAKKAGHTLTFKGRLLPVKGIQNNGE